MTWKPDDAVQREKALDIDQSWIVQAPAGSGKTGILVYRILKLLAVAERPEQILAITFTRKAAKEMRDRLLELLTAAANQAVTDDPFEAQGLALAQAVIARDAEQGWQLLDMPHRLNIETIDALSARLVSNMPWLSRFGDRPNTTEKAQEHFHFAVEQMLSELLDEQSPIYDDLRQLMLSLDNNYQRLKGLLTVMLGKRDQWLRYFVGNAGLSSIEAREELERAWQAISENQLSSLLAAAPIGAKDTIIHSAKFAADHLLTVHLATSATERKPLNCAFQCFIQDTRFPNADFADMEGWLAIQALLLTGKGELRKRGGVNVKLGFLPKTPEKEAFQNLLESLENEPEFVEQLANVHRVPPPSFTDEQWQQLTILERVLRRLLSHLQLRFHNAKECDFSEIAQRANLALSDLGKPTDLALRMDYQIQHILVDEFQDTSHAQSTLLENLSKGWQQGDGRTLFLVGDPMQSIYRFREADVGLFLEAASESGSINDIQLNPLVLTENFRSKKRLVDWFNALFVASFPKQNDETSGAIIYSSASSHKTEGVTPELKAFHSDEEEAHYVVETVKTALQRGDKKIAILVRSRGQLAPILPALSAAGIVYDGVDIRPLNKTQSVLDVVALCKALVRLDDKVSWLALLRGPMVGLSLAELTDLTEGKDALVWERLQDKQRLNSLSHESNLRLKRLLTVMTTALQQKQQLPLASLTQWAWQALGGEQTLAEITLEDLEPVWQLVNDIELGGDIDKLADLESGLEGLYTQSGNQHLLSESGVTQTVTVSTIHKSKGLQYDTVILPGLSRMGRNNDKDILRWAEAVERSGTCAGASIEQRGRKRLLMAPLESSTKQSKDATNSHYEYLQQLEKQRDKNEQMRLLYVACTRAETYLHLSGQFKINAKGDLTATGLSRSLLAGAWEHLQDQFFLEGEPEETLTSDGLSLNQTLTRLPANFVLNSADKINWQSLTRTVSQDDDSKEMVYEWASSIAQTTGILLHEWLEHHGEQLATFKLDDAQKSLWRAELMAMNLEPEKIPSAIKRLSIAIVKMQQDERARWIFSQHREAKNEYALSSVENGIVQNYRLDRTFLDEQGTRWIIDYKSTTHFDDDVEQFVDQQIADREYADQLNRYALAFSRLENTPIKLGLYFPLLTQWREWEYQA